MSWRSLASRLVSGSSSRRMRGRPISARPSARRCCSPPESVAGLRSEPVADAQHLGRLVDPPARSPPRRPRLAQRVGEVLRHRQMRVEREGLKHHRHAAAADRRVGDVGAVDLGCCPASGRTSPAIGPQRRRLADRARAEQHEEPALGDLEVSPSSARVGADRACTTPARLECGARRRSCQITPCPVPSAAFCADRRTASVTRSVASASRKVGAAGSPSPSPRRNRRPGG